MLTIFGRKKKDEKPGETGLLDTGSNETEHVDSPVQSNQPSPQPNVQPARDVSQARDTPQARVERPTPPVSRYSPAEPYIPEETTSLNKLLQSLIHDLPSSPGQGQGSEQPATPDYVPIRAQPPSRAMVIDSKGAGKGSMDEDEDDDGFETKGVSPVRVTKPADFRPPPPKIETPNGQSVNKDQESADKPGKPEKPEKAQAKPSPPSPPKKGGSPAQGFDHIFQLAQGNLESTSLVILNGAPGSGKTSVCSALTENYIKLGNPCLYLTYDQSPSTLRESMKKLGGDPERHESQFRFLLIDGFSSQNDSFSMEPYYVEQAFDLDSITDVLTRNTGIFSGEKVRVFYDSLDKLVAKVPQKEFTKKFTDLANKMRDNGATFIVTVDLSKLSKDLSSSLEEMADCVIDISRDGSEGTLKVRRVNKSNSKIDPETFQIEPGKGIVFV
ncbi:MAG TPA: RAD55 family ATPase [Candidatus Bathyarchaeia archaeon]|nr:RAD55 family ATPase [Candidatus Bathyarchaeia archaeon]